MNMTAGSALDNNLQLVFEVINSSESTLFDKKKACGFVEKLLALQGQINHESVSIFIRLLDELLLADKEQYLARDVLQRISWLEPKDLVMLDKVFFVWIGCLSERQLEYFDVWEEVCQDDTFIYYDSRCLLASEIKDVLCRIHNCSHEDVAFIKHQSDWFEAFVESKERHLDEWLIDHTRVYDADIATELEHRLYRVRHRYYRLTKLVTLIDIASIDSLFVFSGFDLEPYYLYEVLLRNNLAAASDIVRLLVLYHQGGMYVDFDTLPSFEHCFPKTNRRFPEWVSNNMVDVLKAELVMNVFRTQQLTRFARCQGDHQLVENLVATFFDDDKEQIKSLHEDVAAITEDKLFHPFILPPVHKEGLALTKAKNSVGEFNNNVLIAPKGSKLIRIVLTMMSSRYRYMEDNGIIFDDIFNSRDCDVNNRVMESEEYWLRFSDYRYDHLRSSDNVTLFLSGPSLVLEVLISLAYEVFDIEGCSPNAVAFAMSHPDLKMAFEHQTQFTVEHMRSTWLRNQNLFSD
ncbi:MULTISPECIES: TcdA/TcdB catalytic glycosyltransferase domain-containing protein [Vibrio]|uniref:TcdA/TcdB catalytic glycosyltransferase domain-containing protein n=1 Tax=Vibrio TaxID=662 RepID=UPI001CF077E0|nr:MULTISPECIES: TcdA/TcdB catalytic glycosyltransferase domain-containing protein [Vibrio]MDN3633005.1 TcdA/TcdB catalytic glycosyltransferase domain-containing protein [Vibrio lentus]